jgi:hypothetical protein
MAWKMSNKQSFNRALILSLVVVFGMTLFSCEEDEVHVVREIQRTAQSFLSEIPNKAEIIVSNANGVGEPGTDEDQAKKGKFHVSSNAVVPPKPEIIEELLGEVAIIEKTIELEEDIAIRGEVVCTTEILGGMSWSPAYAEALVDPVVSEVEMSGLVYPNPAKNETTLKVTMPATSEAEIRLFSMNGQYIRTIHSGRVQEGETDFQMNLTDLKTGMYLVILICDGKKETIKFSKI